MRLGSAMLLGLIAALLTLAAPTLARNSNHEQKTRAAPASSGCNAYQQRRRHMEAIALPGNGFKAGDAAEIRIEARGRGDALNNQAVSYRRVTINPIRKAIANDGIGAARVAAAETVAPGRWRRHLFGEIPGHAADRIHRASDPRFGDCGSGRSFIFHECSNARTVEQVPKRQRHVWSAMSGPRRRARLSS